MYSYPVIPLEGHGGEGRTVVGGAFPNHSTGISNLIGSGTHPLARYANEAAIFIILQRLWHLALPC